MLCSDGLSDLVDDEAITRTLIAKPVSKDACEQLVQMALDAGGRDNVTVVVAGYNFPTAD
jgi:serine/threonine protein phosphatase PrpC